MPYIGQSLTEGTRREYSYVATAGQTVFPAIYTVGAVDVYQNGVLLAPSDYTATTGTTVVFNTGAALNDEITIHCHNTFSVADTVSASQGGTFNSDVTVVGDLTVDTGNVLVGTTTSASTPLHVYKSSGEVARFSTPNGQIGSIVIGRPDVSTEGAKLQYNSNNGEVTLGSVYTGHPIVISSGTAERMRIDSSGNLLLGKTAVGTANAGMYVLPSGQLGVTNVNATSGTSNIVCRRDTQDGSFIGFSKDGTAVGGISGTSSGTTYNTTSDRRLKTDIQPITNATDKLMAMNPVSHKWKADPEAGAVHGFIAQEMQEIIPEAVSGTPDGEEMMSMDYGRITPVLVAALQDAHKKIEALEERLAVLEDN